MPIICSRCNCHALELSNKLCQRCQDILEFGYPSFKAYPLEQRKEEQELVLLEY